MYHRMFLIHLDKQNKNADVLLGNNVLAHIPDLNDFLYGMKILLKPDGVISMEFPHLLRLIELNQFDTIYHEHINFFNVKSMDKLVKRCGLKLDQVVKNPIHGTSYIFVIKFIRYKNI